ncbi:VWA domain-containing protein [Merismopedia glauca]|uniref:VWA domain-containing protein n=1 Tax=Merismopedia glauca CCAP 1448/3 TaxID=1296344 RepID=A0A2T1BZ16_9CYAN|nr:VWA domain-containing protein [Merismopedia glauca]PSB01242.1 hypothetical protein C7B64_19325 [Merismopedia glauca CCAP 1448/3]
MTSSIATPGQTPNSLQAKGLDLVARIHGGRDVVLAIDLTESVGINDEGRIRLQQIVKDSLKPGDTVYVVPFAATVSPLQPNVNTLAASQGIPFNGQAADIDTILRSLPFQANLTLKQTDIEQAELTIYQGLAQLNHERLLANSPIKSQSVVWITDAPLFTQSGNEWTETPVNSPFRVANSLESQQRLAWLQALPLYKRSLPIQTQKGEQYNLTVVDLPPTVQEFCTPSPGGNSTCLVTPYLLQQLWLPATGLGIVLLGGLIAIKRLISWQKKWKILVDFVSDSQFEEQICYLLPNQRLAIGEYESNCVDAIASPGNETRGYLERLGNRLYLIPTDAAPLYCNGRQISQRTILSSGEFTINCPTPNLRDFEFVVKVKK